MLFPIFKIIEVGIAGRGRGLKPLIIGFSYPKVLCAKALIPVARIRIEVNSRFMSQCFCSLSKYMKKSADSDESQPIILYLCIR